MAPVAPRPLPLAVQAGHQHAEAFNLMYYENEETGLGFLVFNPRDGVTPYGLVLEGVNYHHQHFSLDRYLPRYQAPAGMRFFRDRTLEEARAAAERRVAAFDGSEYEVAAEDREQRIQNLIPDFLRMPTLDRVPI